MRVAVAGGSGTVGRHVVAALTEAGHEPVVLGRARGTDLLAVDAVTAALRDVTAVVDVSNISTLRARRSVAFFGAVTANLLAAAAANGVSHLVALSIVGVDRVGLGYYRGKRHQEQLLLAGRSPVPTSVLRATQFHEFAGQLVARSRGPVVVVPTMRCQPVAAREVGAALAALATGPAVGLADELAGPQPEQLADLVRRWLQATGSRQRVVSFRLPGSAGRLAASGALLPTGPGPRGRQAFAEWLAGPDGPGRS